MNENTPLISYNKNINTLEEREERGFIESIIGNKEFIAELKNSKNKLGQLMKLDYFIKENFDALHKKFEEIKGSFVNKSISSKPFNVESRKEKKKIDIKENELKTLEDFENYYLENNEFIYPDSIPYHEYPLGEKFVMTEGEREFRLKYKEDILLKDNRISGVKKKIFY